MSVACSTKQRYVGVSYSKACSTNVFSINNTSYCCSSLAGVVGIVLLARIFLNFFIEVLSMMILRLLEGFGRFFEDRCSNALLQIFCCFAMLNYVVGF